MRQGPFTAPELRKRHRAAMMAIGEWGDSAYHREHEDDVVGNVLAFQRGERDRPWVHSHGASERGYCDECDAAYLLDALESESPEAES